MTRQSSASGRNTVRLKEIVFVKSQMVKLNLHNKDLAAKLQINPMTVSRLLRGEVVSSDTAHKLYTYLRGDDVKIEKEFLELFELEMPTI